MRSCVNQWNCLCLGFITYKTGIKQWWPCLLSSPVYQIHRTLKKWLAILQMSPPPFSLFLYRIVFWEKYSSASTNLVRERQYQHHCVRFIYVPAPRYFDTCSLFPTIQTNMKNIIYGVMGGKDSPARLDLNSNLICSLLVLWSWSVLLKAALAWWFSWLEHLPIHRKVLGSISVRADWCFTLTLFFSLSLSLPPALSTKKEKMLKVSNFHVLMSKVVLPTLTADHGEDEMKWWVLSMEQGTRDIGHTPKL